MYVPIVKLMRRQALQALQVLCQLHLTCTLLTLTLLVAYIQQANLWLLCCSTCREGVVKAEGVPNGEDLLPHPQRSRLPELHRPQQALGRIDVQHADVLVAVCAHQRSVKGLVEAVHSCRQQASMRHLSCTSGAAHMILV